MKIKAPAKSPDLNPIEMVWANLKKHIRKQIPTNIEQLKDSCMFQIYLIENNFDKEYINYDASERFDYKNIIIDVVEFEKSYYIEMKNNFGEESSIEEDAQDISLRNYIENYSKLPLTTYAIQGWYSVGDILV